jgi:hypothetical protein
MPLPFNAVVVGVLQGRVTGPPGGTLGVPSLFSQTELSGMKTDPAAPVKVFGDMFASDGGSVVFTYPLFPGGKLNPSEQMAQAKFWVKNVVAIATAVTRRMRRPVLCCVFMVALTLIIAVVSKDHVGVKFAPPEVPAAANLESATSMPIEKCGFHMLRTGSITVELKLQAELCQPDQTGFHNSSNQRTKQICTSGPVAIRQ